MCMNVIALEIEYTFMNKKDSTTFKQMVSNEMRFKVFEEMVLRKVSALVCMWNRSGSDAMKLVHL